jgi:hypothetical protein
MWYFLDFLRGDVDVTTCIDSICFSGPREEVYAALNTFLTRVFSCNFSLNGFEDGKDLEFLALSEENKKKLFRDMEEEHPEFLGEKYNFTKKTRQVTAKSLEKLELVWKALAHYIKSNMGPPKIILLNRIAY